MGAGGVLERSQRGVYEIAQQVGRLVAGGAGKD